MDRIRRNLGKAIKGGLGVGFIGFLMGVLTGYIPMAVGLGVIFGGATFLATLFQE